MIFLPPQHFRTPFFNAQNVVKTGIGQDGRARAGSRNLKTACFTEAKVSVPSFKTYYFTLFF